MNKEDTIMKKLNSLYIARFLQIAAIAYLAFCPTIRYYEVATIGSYSSDPCHLSNCNDN